MERKRFVAWVAALSLLVLSSFLTGAGMGHEGHDMKSGELLFSGKIGPWAGEARLIEKRAYMEQSGVPAKFAAKFAGELHLMMFLTDPMTGKPPAGAAGAVTVTGPDKAATKVTLVVMEGHIGVDVSLPQPGEYTFTVEIESGGRKGSATFSHTVK